MSVSRWDVGVAGYREEIQQYFGDTPKQSTPSSNTALERRALKLFTVAILRYQPS